MALRRSHFQCGKCEGRRSQSSVARTPSLALPPRWARKEFFVVVCAALLTFFCMLRYSEWNVVPTWFLDSSIFMVVRWADLVSGFFNIHGDTLGQSGSGDSSVLIGIFCTNLAFQDRTPSPLPSPVLFFPVGWKRQPEEGGIGPGCCGGGVITTWAAGDGVIAAGAAV